MNFYTLKRSFLAASIAAGLFTGVLAVTQPMLSLADPTNDESSVLSDSQIQTLGLNEEAKTKLKALREESQTKAKLHREKIATKRKAFMDYLNSPNANKQQALTMQQELMQLQDEWAKSRIETHFKLKEILTPEQLEKLRASRKQQMQQRGGAHRPPAAAAKR